VQVTTGTTPQLAQTWNCAVFVPKAYVDSLPFNQRALLLVGVDKPAPVGSRRFSYNLFEGRAEGAVGQVAQRRADDGCRLAAAAQPFHCEAHLRTSGVQP